MPIILGYIVAVYDNERKMHKFLEDSGYPNFTWRISNAKIFKNEKSAEKIIKTEFDNEKIETYSDGTKYPSRMICDALNLNNEKIKGEGVARVLPLQLGQSVYNKDIKGEIIYEPSSRE